MNLVRVLMENISPLYSYMGNNLDTQDESVRKCLGIMRIPFEVFDSAAVLR